MAGDMCDQMSEDATYCRGQKVVHDLDKALARSLDELRSLQMAWKRVHKSNEGICSGSGEKARAKKDLKKQIERIDLSALRLDSASQMIDGLSDAIAANEKVKEIYERQSKIGQWRTWISLACTFSAALLGFATEVLAPVLRKAAADILHFCGYPSAAAVLRPDARASAVRDILQELVDCLRSIIHSYDRKKEGTEQALADAEKRRAAMVEMQLKVAQLHGELRSTSASLIVRPGHKLSSSQALLNDQTLADQLERVKQIKASCSNLDDSIGNAQNNRRPDLAADRAPARP